jgi:hypothetical protein
MEQKTDLSFLQRMPDDFGIILPNSFGGQYTLKKCQNSTHSCVNLQQVILEIAKSFYLSQGFELLGTAIDCAPGKTIDNSDIVLRRML